MPGNYSTSEIDTGYTWVDGSTIYKKTIDFGALLNNSIKSVNHDISNLGFIVKIEGMSLATTGTSLPIPFASISSSGNNIDISITTSAIIIATGADRRNLTQTYITIYYTKTS